MNPYFTPTPFDSDNSNSAFYNMHQLSTYSGNGVLQKYGFMYGLKELLLLNAISQKITNKKKNKQQTKRKNQNQAYRRVDLDLDEMSLVANVYSNFIRAWVV